ncbi:hypothetical protein PJ985_02775 [Streptomyces sp. ACA25]|uniref:hypothetical protein n=1 Tax=Streptomyces sp. ACA25 TaxID=3022596 RepID=UPI0023071758|nr:hypothetical protein [Streptomyces sp. ACA25]MDB1086491.1 hypothetical protein [Streptomyces sp. ACA25]
MIERTSLPMWVDSDVIQLHHVLGALPENAWAWRMLHFSGMGQAPKQSTMEDFEDQAGRPGGYLFSWPELRGFAQRLHQVCDCVLVAVDGRSPADLNRLEREAFEGCHVAIEAIDSGEWVLGVSRRVPQWQAVHARWKDLVRPV